MDQQFILKSSHNFVKCYTVEYLYNFLHKNKCLKKYVCIILYLINICKKKIYKVNLRLIFNII